MPVNRFFNTTTFAGEQNLVEDLIVEAIQVYGHSAYYVPRETADMDHLFGEDPLAHFNDAREIELYIKSSTAMGGQGILFSKFGMVSEDQMTFLMAVRRFGQVLGDKLTRPREGDIIYISMNAPEVQQFIFEIRFVQQTEQLFQLGKLYTYELRCETMNYTHERVQTNVPDINTVAEREAYTIKITMASGSGDFLVGEAVYQGGSFITADATGTVGAWDGSILSVQNITGAFSNTEPVIGINSGATWTPAATPSTVPDNLHPGDIDLSDNNLLGTEAPSIVQPISNPRFTG